MGHARERFVVWVDKACKSQHVAATRLGCSPSMVSNVASGKRRPGADLRFSIAAATKDWEGGQILAEEWSKAASTEAPVEPTAAEG